MQPAEVDGEEIVRLEEHVPCADTEGAEEKLSGGKDLSVARPSFQVSKDVDPKSLPKPRQKDVVSELPKPRQKDVVSESQSESEGAIPAFKTYWFKPIVRPDGFIEWTRRIRVKKPKPEPHDTANPISELLSTATFASLLPNPVRIVDMGDVIMCDTCGRLAKFIHYGVHTCKHCALEVLNCIENNMFPRNDCDFREILELESENCRGRCKNCRFHNAIVTALDRRDEYLALKQEEYDAEEEYKSSKLAARTAFLERQLHHVEFEWYGGKDFRRACTSLQHLNDAFEASFKKHATYINSIEFLRKKLKNADRTALMRAYAAKHFVLEMLRRSQQLRGFRRLVVFDLDCDWSYVRDDEDLRKKIMGSWFESALKPLTLAHNYDIEDEEYAYMRAICFFNPEAPNLEAKEFVKAMNEWFTKKFEEHLETKLRIEKEKKRDIKKKIIGFPELHHFRLGAIALAGLLLVLLAESKTKKSELMEELCKHSEFIDKEEGMGKD